MRAARLSELAYDHIKTMLLEGRVSANAWLPIEEIAADLGASRQPVMDAMKRLVLDGFIEIVPQVGCRVRDPDPQEIDDFFKLFAAGEALISELAARRAQQGEVLNLRLISGQIGELVRAGGSTEQQGADYRVLNRRFHAEIRHMARSRTLSDVVEGLGDRSDFYVALTNKEMFGLNIEQSHREHEEIIAAIARGDDIAARAAMEHHIFATERRVLKSTEDAGTPSAAVN